jgi:hypothetical protein
MRKTNKGPNSPSPDAKAKWPFNNNKKKKMVITTNGIRAVSSRADRKSGSLGLC